MRAPDPAQARSVRRLSSPPATPLMFARAGAALLPLASRLPFVGGAGGELPDLELTLDDISVDRGRLAAYDRVCGFTLSDRLPATYPHMLAFPLHLALLTDGSFPFGAIGLVHIANRITQIRPISADETLSLRVWAEDLRSHPRGQQFAILTEARVGDELVWTAVSTNLRRGSSGGGNSETSAASPRRSPAPPPAATWRLPGDLGRRYAAVSGDHNPIHISGISARLFGFPSAIAHGMWTKARSLAALGPRLPDAFTASVEFKRPILLPATVAFWQTPLADPGADELGFGVVDARKGTPHLTGEVAVPD